MASDQFVRIHTVRDDTSANPRIDSFQLATGPETTAALSDSN